MAHLQNHDIDALLAQAVLQICKRTQPHYRNIKSFFPPTEGLPLYPVVVHLGTCFLRVMGVGIAFNDACGRLIELRGLWQFFDGVI